MPANIFISRKILQITFLLFLFPCAICNAQLTPRLIDWHSHTPEKLIFSYDGRYLLSFSDNQTILTDLKIRKPIASLTGLEILAASTTRNIFYTRSKKFKDTLFIETRSFDDGKVIGRTAIPERIEDYRIVSPFIMGIDFDPEAYALPYTSYKPGAKNKVFLFNKFGVVVHQLIIPDNDRINEIKVLNAKVWLLTNRTLYSSEDDQFHIAFKSGSETDNFANFKFHNDTLLVLSNEYIRWIESRNFKVVRKAGVKSFFAQNESEFGKGLMITFNHPFAVDEDGYAWLVNTTSINEDRSRLEEPSYTICRLNGISEAYPLSSKDKSYSSSAKTEIQFAYNDRQQIFAICSADKKKNSVTIIHKTRGELFTIGEGYLPIEKFWFTADPGKIILETGLPNKTCLLLNFKNGNVETTGALDYNSMLRNPARYSNYKQVSSKEKIFNSEFSNFQDAPYFSLPGDNPVLGLPLYDPVLSNENLRNGKLVITDSLNRVIKSVELKDIKGDKISERYAFVKYSFDTTKNYLTLHYRDRYDVSTYLQIVVDYANYKVIKRWKYDDVLLIPGTDYYLCNLGLMSFKGEEMIFPFERQYQNAINFTATSNGKFVCFSIAGYDAPDKLYTFEINTKKISFLGEHRIKTITADPFSSLIYSVGYDSKIKVWDPKSGKEKATIVIFGKEKSETVKGLEGGYLIYSPEGYYMGEKNYFNLLSMRDSLCDIPFFQMDAQFHRPDKILSELGYADTTLIEILRKVSENRIRLQRKSSGTSDIRFSDKLKIPFYSEASVIIDAKTTGVLTSYKGIMIYVNGTALIPFPGQSIKEISSGILSLNIDLVDEVNFIRLCLVGPDNKETAGDYVYINSKPRVKRNLYLIGIGISAYKSKEYNLKYAEKDITDVLNFFNTSSTFAEIYTYKITNENVLISLPDSLKKFLKNAGSKDQVLVYYAGHGLLDRKTRSYFLSTYNWDQSSPAETGINYESLIAAVGSCGARKKTVIIDACNSGLIDDLMTTTDTIQPVKDAGKKEEIVVTRGATLLGENTITSSALKLAFRQLNPGNGVDVLAASAGNELAQEGGGLKNGLFTYCLLSAFKSGEADLDQDGVLSVNEIQNYVSPMVVRLSKGSQRPSYRQSNLYTEVPLLNYSDSYFSLFLLSAQRDNVSELKNYVEKEKLPINKQDKNGFTALMYACREGSFRSVRYLVGAGAGLDYKTTIGFSTLYLAAYNGNHEIAYFLLDKGAKNDLSPWQLEEIRKKGNKDVLRVLTEFDKLKMARGKYLKLIQLLSDSKINEADSLFKKENLKVNDWLITENTNAIFTVIGLDKYESLKWLISAGANLNFTRTDLNNISPLMLAVYIGNVKTVKLLLENGANKNALDSNGQTALDYAYKNGNKEIIELLK